MRVAPSLACIAAGFLGACSSFGGDNNPFTVFADPGQYQYHTCEQIASIRDSSAKRAQDLKLLMDKAEQSTGGSIVNVIAYKSDYVSAREDVKVLDATARSKNCPAKK
jgi:hypothetical protein